jgi:hypothetical protein
MVNGAAPPTGDQHSEFENSALLTIPQGANSVAAFDDYTLYEYVALQMEDSSQGSNFSSINVTKDPAVLTATVEEGNWTGTLTSQIANNSFQSSIGLTNVNTANFSYTTTVKLINNSDGSQSIEIQNVLTKSSVSVNSSNPIVISAYAIYATLALLSPLYGIIFWTICQTIEYYIRQALASFAEKL